MTTFTLIAYLLVLIVISIQSFKKIENFADFFVARNKGTVLTITGSLVATILGGSAVIGTIDEGKTLGWASAWFMICASIGLFALLPLVSKVKRQGKFTMPELLGDLFGPQLKVISSFIIPVAWLGVIAVQLIASGKILQSFTGMDYTVGVVISGLVFTAYTIAGGQFSVLKTDLFQAIFILLSLLILAFFGLNHPTASPVFGFHLSFPFNSNFSIIDLVILLITYSLTFTAGPDIYSRIFSANNEATSRKSVLITALILIPVGLIIGYLAVFGAYNSINDDQGAVLINITKAILPNWIVPLIVIGLLSVVLSSASTTLLSASIIIVGLLDKNQFNARSIAKTRYIMILIGLLGILISINFSSIIGMLMIALTIYSGAFITPILLGLTGIKVKTNHASVAVIVGGIVALSGKIISYSGNTKTGNLIIVLAFILNGCILLIGRKKTTLN